MDNFNDAMNEITRITTTVSEYKQLSDELSSIIDQIKQIIYDLILSFLGSADNTEG